MSTLPPAQPEPGLYLWETVLLVLALSTPIVALTAFGTSGALQRSGSVMVFFAVLAEFLLLNKANTKHLRNAERVFRRETPLSFSPASKVVSGFALLFAAAGTLLWGFGDCLPL